MTEPISSRPSLQEQFPIFNKIITDAVQENPALSQVESPRLQTVVGNAIKEVEILETLAVKHQQALRAGTLPWSREQIQKIKALWVLSGPGYYRQPFKQDRYEDITWARYMGRYRLIYAGLLMRKFTEALAGIPPTTLLTGKISPSIRELRSLVAAHAPFLLFNGREDENRDVITVLQEIGGIIPPEKVVITEKRIDKTIDQVTSLELPQNLNLQAGDEIGVITHAPHLMRFAHMLRCYQSQLPFPSGVGIRALPLPSPTDGKIAYMEKEIRGLLYYVFITRQASEESYPYKLA